MECEITVKLRERLRAGDERTNDGEGTPWVRPLPPVLDAVVPTHMFSPSHMGVADECLLRAVLGSARVGTPLPASPAADLGTAFHLLLERAVRGEIERSGSAEEDARRELDAILEEANARFAKRIPPGIASDLRTVWLPLEWRRKVRLILDVAVRCLNRGTSSTSTAHGKLGGVSPREPLDFQALPPTGIWTEVRMRAPGLRIGGRADLVEKSSSGVTIVDLKTGRVTDGGVVRPHVARQLRLYGLIARAHAPNTPIRLCVDDGAEREIAFGASEAAEVETWLRSVVDRVPAGVRSSVERLATVGRACIGCGFRHVCPAYRRQAPALWRSGTSHRLPMDIWGVVESLEPMAGARPRRVRLRDVSGRIVSVSGLHAARVEGIGPGAPLYLFGLRTRDRIGSHEANRHPLNFFESVPGDPYDRAWSLAAFTSNTACAG